MASSRRLAIIAVGLLSLGASGAVFAAAFDSSARAPLSTEAEIPPADRFVEPDLSVPAVAAARVDGLGITLRPSTSPGITCLSLEGLPTADGSTASGICTQTAAIAQHGLLVSSNQADGGITYYGVGPAGTKTVLFDGRLLAADHGGLFIVRDIKPTSSGTFVFDLPAGTKSLDFGPLPPLPAP